MDGYREREKESKREIRRELWREEVRERETESERERARERDISLTIMAAHHQANFAAVPQQHSFDFLLFCLRNPRACPLLEVLDPGDVEPKSLAPGANVCTDIPMYSVYENGTFSHHCTEVVDLYRGGAGGEAMVGFLLGCSFSWEEELAKEGLTPRNVEVRI